MLTHKTSFLRTGIPCYDDIGIIINIKMCSAIGLLATTKLTLYRSSIEYKMSMPEPRKEIWNTTEEDDIIKLIFLVSSGLLRNIFIANTLICIRELPSRLKSSTINLCSEALAKEN